MLSFDERDPDVLSVQFSDRCLQLASPDAVLFVAFAASQQEVAG
jgi:hypothetical protein